MPQRDDALRDLVFVLIGLRSELVSAESLAAAFQEWDCVGPRSFIETLMRKGGLSDDGYAELERLVSAHLAEKTGGLDSSTPTVGPHTSGKADVTVTVEPVPAGGRVDPVKTSPPLLPPWLDDQGYVVQPTAPVQRFQIEDVHAEGGLGIVYRAYDHELKRVVALKKMKDQYADNPARRSRFELEAEITARMEYRGVVPVYGRGTDEEGRPYYAMQLVHGVSLREAIVAFRKDPALKDDPGRRSLELRKLLRRFIDVCNTIEYAHGSGVIHRDIKPDNIMVGEHGETLMVDWGIAKVGGRPDVAANDTSERASVGRSGKGTTGTLPGTTMGTLAFMSPEQAKGELELLDARSDVYSLGATLFFLLTGRTAIEQGEAVEVLRKVRESEFPPPRQLDRSIAPALEAVCLKAMAGPREDRYGSARALADDLERWMADEPVSVHRDPLHERARRWMRRHRPAVAAAAAAACVAVAGLVAVLVVQQRSNRALHQANARVQDRFDLAMKAIGTFHTGVSEDVLLKQDEFREQRTKLLRQARLFYREIELKLAGQPDRASRGALARAYFEMARLTALIDSVDDALEDHLQALRLREELAAEAGATLDSWADLAASLTQVALIEGGNNQLGEGETKLQRILSIWKGLVEASPSRADFQRGLASTYRHLGDLYRKTDRADKALSAFRTGRKIRRALVDKRPNDSELLAELASSDFEIGRLLAGNDKRLKEAVEALLASSDVYRDLVERNPERLEFRQKLAKGLHELANLYSSNQRTREADEAYREAKELSAGLVGLQPAVSGFQIDLAAVLTDSAIQFYRLGRLPEAVAAFRRSHDILLGAERLNPKSTRVQRNLALSDVQLATPLEETGQVAESLQSLAEARRRFVALLDNNEGYGDIRLNLAGVYRQSARILADNGQPGEALHDLEFARGQLLYLVEKNPDDIDYKRHLAACQGAIGVLLSRFGRPDQAREEIDRAERLLVDLHNANLANTEVREQLANTQVDLARVLAEIGQLPAATDALGRARVILGPLVRDNPRDVSYRQGLASFHRAHGELLDQAGLPDEALCAFDQALAVLDPLAKENPEMQTFQVDRARVERLAGESMLRAGQVTEARAAFERALSTLVKLDHRGPGVLVEAARAHADLVRLAGLTGADVSPGTAVAEAAAALDDLRGAVRSGFRDPAAVASDRAFDAIRDRDDFKAVLADMAFPLDPFTIPPDLDAPSGAPR